MNYLNQPNSKRNLFFISLFFFSILNLFSQPSYDCQCPEGGKYPAGTILPSTITGELTDKDKVLGDYLDCWDFGKINQVPRDGVHYINYYRINVSVSGEYSFSGSDGNKLLIGIFEGNIGCSHIVGGTGGYVGDSTYFYFEEPKNNGKINNSFELDSNTVYYIVLSDFDKDFVGEYQLVIDKPVDSEIIIQNNIYDPECRFFGCYDKSKTYDFPLPIVDSSIVEDISWTQHIVSSSEECGTEMFYRYYTITDTSGNTSYCDSEYYFSGANLAKLKWPTFWDGREGNNPVLTCADSFELDSKNNPSPSYTGFPSGYDGSCGTVEFFYSDNVYNKDDGVAYGTKILRLWTIVDDCSGGIYTHYQVIKIKDDKLPGFTESDTISISVNTYECIADVKINDLLPPLDSNFQYLKRWITVSDGEIIGDINNNGLIDYNESWEIKNLPIGYYKLCYFYENDCEEEYEECVVLRVYDGSPPIALCKQYQKVYLSNNSINLRAKDFDEGSFDNCNPLYYKVLRVGNTLEYDGGCEELNGDDLIKYPYRFKDNYGVWHNNEVWYDDKVFFCDEDIENEVFVSLRVFDIDPDEGPIDPMRTVNGGDLYGRYNDCWGVIKINCNDKAVLNCPSLSVTCEESLDPEINSKLKISIEGGCGADLKYIDNRKDSFSNKIIERTWTTVGIDDTVSCVQIIYLSDTLTPIDPCTIVLPKDTTIYCSSVMANIEIPTWESNACSFVKLEFHDDTFHFVQGVRYKIVRDWIIIDWGTYKNNTGQQYVDLIQPGQNKFDCDSLIQDGYYKTSQTILIQDFHAPEIVKTPDLCLPVDDCYAYDLEFGATAIDTCNLNQNFNWKYIVKNMDTWETVQYSFNYKPEPSTGVVGKRTKDKLEKTDKAKIVMRVPLPIGNYRISWTVGDGAGNAYTLHQKVTVVDKTPPTPVLVDIATRNLINVNREIKAKSFDKGGCGDDCLASFDNCTNKDSLYFTFSDKIPHLWDDPHNKWLKQFAKYGKYFFDPMTGLISTQAKYFLGESDAWLPDEHTSQRVYQCPENLDTLSKVSIYLFDKFDDKDEVGECDANNYSFKNVNVYFGCEPNSSDVSGTVKTTNGKRFTGMNMIAKNSEAEYNSNTLNGNYHFNLENGKYIISGYSNDDFLEGLNTADIILIQDYLLGIKEIDDPLKDIAMDINNDGKIAASDILLLNRLILKKLYSFKKSAWIAISDSFDFDYNPIGGYKDPSLQEVILIGNHVYDVDFTAVKMGDIDNSVFTTPKPRQDKGFTLVAENKTIVKDDTIEIPVYVKNFNEIKGFQLSMNISGLEIISIDTDSKIHGNHSFNVINDNLLFSFVKQYEEIEDNDLFLTIKVKSLVDGKIEDIFSLNDVEIRTEAYSGEDLEVTKIDMEFKTPVGTEEIPLGFKLYQNKPNPFSNKTTIGFDLPEASEYKLSIYDITGKELKNQVGQGREGYNKVKIDMKGLSIKGMLFYKLESANNTAIRKMLVL